MKDVISLMRRKRKKRLIGLLPHSSSFVFVFIIHNRTFSLFYGIENFINFIIKKLIVKVQFFQNRLYVSLVRQIIRR